METSNLYDVLGVDKNATEEELKLAYRKAAKENHTDKGGDNDKMILVNKAYDVLKNPKKKEHYDKTGETEMHGFDKRFAEVINTIFIKIISEVDVERNDLLELFKKNIHGMLVNGKNEKKKIEDSLVKLEKVLERLTAKNNAMMIQVLNNNILGTKNNIAIYDTDISFLEDCLEVLESYHYKFEAPEPTNVFNPMNRGTFTFYQQNI